MAAIISNRKKLGVKECFIECPNCHSKETGADDYARAALIVGAIFCIPIITVPLGVIAFVMAVFARAFQRNIKIKCDACGRTFLVSRKDYSEHLRHLKNPEKIHLQS